MSILLLSLLAVIALVQSGAYLVMVYESRRACAGAREKLARQLWWPFALECLLVEAALGCALLSRLRSPRRPHGRAPRPVALVHDLATSPWTLWLLARRLERSGWQPFFLEYPSGDGDLYAKAGAVASELSRACRDCGAARMDVIAHGVGGLLVRAAAAFDGASSMLGNVVTLGTPHQGTALASLVTGPRFAQLRPGSPFLARLAGTDVTSSVRVTAIGSSFDAWVFPLESAYYPGAFNITVDAVGHLGLLVSGRTWELVRENLEFAGAPARSQAA